MPRWKKAMRWVGRGLILSLAATLIGAALGSRWERAEHNAFLDAQYAPPGEIINVGAQDIHVVAQGTGSPGVLLISGLGLWT